MLIRPLFACVGRKKILVNFLFEFVYVGIGIPLCKECGRGKVTNQEVYVRALQILCTEHVARTAASPKLQGQENRVLNESTFFISQITHTKKKKLACLSGPNKIQDQSQLSL